MKGAVGHKNLDPVLRVWLVVQNATLAEVHGGLVLLASQPKTGQLTVENLHFWIRLDFAAGADVAQIKIAAL